MRHLPEYTIIFILSLSSSCITGGPLSKGDIEDYKGKSHVMCPWHGYMFDLETGKNEIGIMVKYSVLLFCHNAMNVM